MFSYFFFDTIDNDIFGTSHSIGYDTAFEIFESFFKPVNIDKFNNYIYEIILNIKIIFISFIIIIASDYFSTDLLTI